MRASEAPLSQWTFSRRRFLSGAAATSLAAVMAGRAGATTELLSWVSSSDQPRITPISMYTFSVERDLDLLQLDMEFFGFLTTEVDKLPALAPKSATGLITVQFPPQAIGEPSYGYAGGDWNVDPPPVLSALSQPSVLCFSTGSPVKFPTMTVSDLLDWADWELLVPGPAHVNSGSGAGPQNPVGTNLSYIEYPYGLFLSPTVDAKRTPDSGFATSFVGSTGTPALGQNNPLWTASLVQTTLHPHSSTPRLAQAAAVWAADYDSNTILGDDGSGDVSISYRH